MFSAFWKYLTAASDRPTHQSDEETDSAVEHQVLLELSAAAEIGMVATRSQEPGLVVDLEESPPKGTPQAGSAKKRSSPNHDNDVEVGRASKRRKEKPADEPSGTVNGNTRPMIPIVPSSANNNNRPLDGIEVRIVNESRPNFSRSTPQAKAGTIASKQNGQQAHEDVDTEPFDSAETRKASAKPLTPLKWPNGACSRDDEQPLPAPAKARHKRFGSEDLQEEHPLRWPENIATQPKTEKVLKVEVDTESEDEAPETVTASKGLDEARSAAIDVAKVADLQRARDKQKRRDRDTRLKLQAKSARPSKRSQLRLTPEMDTLVSPSTLVGSVNEPSEDSEIVSKASKKSRLPILLPEEILSAEPTIRPPTPPPETPDKNSHLVKRRKLLDAESRPPKDVRHGSLTVRVLDSGPGIMPPKASKESRILREAWLTGQRGPKGGIERRKLGGGFVRQR